MRNFYNVIIIGAGFAGLSCALYLKDSNLSVLVLEKNNQVGLKPCGHGITTNDLEFIPKKFLNYNLKPLSVFYNNHKINMPKDFELVSSIDRRKVLKYFIRNLKDNTKIIFNTQLIAFNNNSITINGKKIKFEYLVGADGANSIVRKNLSIPSKKIEIALNYKVPKIYPNFEIHLFDKKFGSGYSWIFPNKEFTSIGCGSTINAIAPQELNQNFHSWLKQQKIKIDSSRLEGAVINYDYRGYRFNNIFLAGEAAGLTNCVTGKGMNAACLSGKQIAHEILGKNCTKNLITEYLKRKKYYESYLGKKKNPLIMMLRGKKIL